MVEQKNVTPSLNRYPDRNSLPFSSSLKELANQSVSQLRKSEQKTERRNASNDYSAAMLTKVVIEPPKTLRTRNKSMIQ